MNYVLAFVDQETCNIYPDASAAPKGSTIFESPEELARVLTTQDADRIRGRILGVSIEHSPSAAAAASRLWHSLSIGAEAKVAEWHSKGYVKQKDNFGNDKNAGSGKKIELIQLIWTKGKDYLIDAFYKKSPRQARQIVDFLVADGNGIWTEDQVEAIMSSHESEMETKQGIIPVWTYYRQSLCLKKILKKVSLADFAAAPEFSGVSLADKKDLENLEIQHTPEG